jgi:hypothetical protein
VNNKKMLMIIKLNEIYLFKNKMSSDIITKAALNEIIELRFF